MRVWIALSLLMAGTPALPAQLLRRPPGPEASATPTTAGPTAGPTTGPTTGRVSHYTHSEPTSRDLFSACDADSDDRLDLFEACEAFETLHGPKDSEGFLRLDLDHDGFLSWPEFDQTFRNIVQRGGTFRVRTCRTLVQQAPERQAARRDTPLQKFLHMHDANGNGGLDPEECNEIARQFGLSPADGAKLQMLDLDHSQRIEEAELAPFFERIRVLLPTLPGEPSGTERDLPPPWAAIDQNQDGKIDANEFRSMLQSLDPALTRWTKPLLRLLDSNQDGSLGPEELPGVQPAGEKKSAANQATQKSTPLPQQAPVR